MNRSCNITVPLLNTVQMKSIGFKNSRVLSALHKVRFIDRLQFFSSFACARCVASARACLTNHHLIGYSFCVSPVRKTLPTLPLLSGGLLPVCESACARACLLLFCARASALWVGIHFVTYGRLLVDTKTLASDEKLKSSCGSIAALWRVQVWLCMLWFVCACAYALIPRLTES